MISGVFATRNLATSAARCTKCLHRKPEGSWTSFASLKARSVRRMGDQVILLKRQRPQETFL